MTRFDPDTLTLTAELDRLASAFERTEAEIGDLQTRLKDDDADRQNLIAERSRKQTYLGELEQMGQAVGQLIDDHGEDATVTVRGLDAGEYAKVKNRTSEAANRTDYQAAPGSGELVFVAAGLVDAPTYDGPPDDLDAKLEWVARQPIGKRKWLQDAIDERTVVGEKNWRELAGRSSAATPAG